MNNEEKKDAIEVLQASIDGKELQRLLLGRAGGWECSVPSFDFSRYKYRVKPKPRECWMFINDGNPVLCGGVIAVFESKEDAMKFKDSMFNYTDNPVNAAHLIKFREVME